MGGDWFSAIFLGQEISFKSPLPPFLKRLYRKSVHGSTGSPRTDHGTLKINYLAVRPERVEGRIVTQSLRERGIIHFHGS